MINKVYTYNWTNKCMEKSIYEMHDDKIWFYQEKIHAWLNFSGGFLMVPMCTLWCNSKTIKTKFTTKKHHPCAINQQCVQGLCVTTTIWFYFLACVLWLNVFALIVVFHFVQKIVCFTFFLTIFRFTPFRSLK